MFLFNIFGAQIICVIGSLSGKMPQLIELARPIAEKRDMLMWY